MANDSLARQIEGVGLEGAPATQADETRRRSAGHDVIKGGGGFDWSADWWSMSDIASTYGLKIGLGQIGRKVGFERIRNPPYRAIAKAYLRGRLLTKTLGLGTLPGYRSALKDFFNAVSDLHPEWTDLKALSRAEVEHYYEILGKRKLAEKTFDTTLGYVRTALADMQVTEEPYAPERSAFALIRDEDYRRIPPVGSVDCVPPKVLAEMLEHLDDLERQMQVVFLAGLKSGLRVNDVLALEPGDVVEVGGRAYIRHYVQKSDVEDHLVPIDEELADVLRAHVEARELDPVGRSSEYLFYVEEGRRAGLHIRDRDVNEAVRALIRRRNIRGEDGRLFHFHYHQLRHTYGIQMRRGGADLKTIQDLLAHASVAVAMRYARALGEDKREAFELARRSGCFDYSVPGSRIGVDGGERLDGGAVQRALAAGEIDIAEVPFGLCLAPAEERCWYASQPPCICADKGMCRDLIVGALSSDVEKYEAQIRAADKLARIAASCGRGDIEAVNRKKAEMMRAIHGVIADGSIVSGDPERLSRRLEGRIRRG